MVASRKLTTVAGPMSIRVSGAVVSGSPIVQVHVAGVASTIPSPSVATTANVCVPSVSGPWKAGETQPASGAPSSEHWNVEPVSLDENSKVALVAVVEPSGPASIVVSGSVPSLTVHVYEAG